VRRPLDQQQLLRIMKSESRVLLGAKTLRVPVIGLRSVRRLTMADGITALGPRSTRWSDAEISDLAHQFSVSRETVLRRLLTFDRTTEEFYRQKRAQYIAEFVASQKRKKEKAAATEMKRNMPQETVSNFGKPLVNMLLDNYHQDRMTLSEISGYLGLKVKHFPKLEEVAGFRDRQWLR